MKIAEVLEWKQQEDQKQKNKTKLNTKQQTRTNLHLLDFVGQTRILSEVSHLFKTF